MAMDQEETSHGHGPGQERIRERFTTGRPGWHEHHADLFAGTERLFRPGYVANLVPAWIPALDGVEEKLRAGARVVDVGCGHGASTILLARSFPASTFVGFDFHAESVEAARKRAAEAGVADRVQFEVARRRRLPRRRLRPRVHLRRPARHAQVPAWCGGTC